MRQLPIQKLNWDIVPAPQCFVVATLASATPAAPFLLRNYEHSAAGQAAAERLNACPIGASNLALWQAVRASSAAPYYLDDFQHGDNRYATFSQPYITID